MRKFTYLFLVMLILTSCKKEEETKPRIQDIKEMVFASGQIEWKDSYQLMAQTDGVLSYFDAEIGDDVQKNQIVAKVENLSSNENLSSAQRNLDLAKQNVGPQLAQIESDLNFAEQKYNQDKIQAERYERLFAKQSVSKNDYENMKLAAQNSLTQINILKQKLQTAKIQNQQSVSIAQSERNNFSIVQSYNQVKAPINGKLINKLKVNGDYVKKGEIIAQIADENQIEVVLNIDENSISKVKVGQQVFVQLNTEKDQVLKGRIKSINSAFDSDSQSFICKATLDNPSNSILYGTQLEANILIAEKKNVMLLPRSVVGYGNKVRVKGKNENIEIKTGIISTDFVEVLSGITKEDIILPLKP